MPTIRALQADDDRSQFNSGDVDLDRFFTKYAGQNQFKHHIGTTYVALNDVDTVVGYATVAAGSIECDELPSSVTKKQKLPAYPLPVLRLARLAVSADLKGQRIGESLLKYVLGLSVSMANGFGCFGVVVDAYTTAVGYYRQYGFAAIGEVLEGESGSRPQPTLMFLSMKDIKAASVAAATARKNAP